METLRVYRFSLGAAALPPCGPAPTAATLAPPPPPPPTMAGPPGPPAGRLSGPAPLAAAVCPAGLAWAAAFPLLITPKANERLTRILATNAPGALPKLRGTIVSPGSGTRLKLPNGVHRIVEAAQFALGPAKLGRSFTCLSRLRSWPVIILNPDPVLATTIGFSTTFHHGKLTVPKRLNRCRMSKELRPNSPDVS